MKEPFLSRRKRPYSTSKKLKLVCSFNGAFQPRPPSGKRRYVGGETRIISVDRNISFLKLRSKVSELCPNIHSFSLKFQLPESDRLVLIASDDDVWCMIDEYDKLESYGKHARLWIYVCNGNDGYASKHYSDMNDNIYVNSARLCGNMFERPDCVSNLCGVKFNGDKFSLRKTVLKQQMLTNQSGRIRSEMEYGCCDGGDDKIFDHPLIDLDSEPEVPMSHESTTQSFEDPYGVSMLNYGISNTHLSGNQNLCNLVPLSPRDGNLRVKTNSSIQCLLGQSEQVMVNGTAMNGGNSSGSVTAEEFSKQLYKSGTVSMSVCSNAKQDPRKFDQALLCKFNRENIVPWNADCNSLKTRLAPLSCSNQLVGSAYPLKYSCSGQGVWGGPQSSIRNHRFGMSDTRNQRMYSHHVQNHQNSLPEIGTHRNVRLDGRPLVGRYSPGLRPSSNISKQGQSVRSYFPNSWKQGTARMIDSRINNQTSHFGLQYGKEHLRGEQGSLAVTQYGMGDQSLFSNVIRNSSPCSGAMGTQEDLLTDPSSNNCEVPYQNLSENLYEVPNNCKPVCCNVKKEPFVMDPQEFVNISGFPNGPGYISGSGFPDSPGYISGSELGCNTKLSDVEAVMSLSNHPKGTNTFQGVIASPVDISLYNLSFSSSKVEPPPLSSLASSDVSEALLKPQLKRLDQMDDGQFSSVQQVELSIGVASNSSSQKAAKLGEVVSKEEIKQEPPSNLSIDEKADTKRSHYSSKVIGGISCDLAAFYTHLATRELQTIKNSDLEYIKELGSGTYGTVFYGKWKGSDVAIKKLKASCFTEGALEEDRLVADFWKEAHILGQLHHPNIVALYGVVTDGPVTNLATVTEYLVNGSLKQVLRRKDRTIDRRKRLIIAMDAAFGMEYLHEKNIVHFDLKSHNFLVNMRDPQRPVCKIGDLGLSKIKQKTLVSGGVRGTIPWMAPELFNCKNDMVTEKIDVYSFGVVMWELLTGEEPYANLRSEEIIAGIIKGNLRPEIPSWCNPAWRSLMERCWSSDPDARPAFSEIAKELRTMSAAMKIK